MGGIVWLASYPKSGNTWMRVFLHNLLRNASGPVDINELDQFTYSDTHTAWYQRFANKPCDQLSKAELAQIRPQVHRLLTSQSADTVFVKTHHFLGEDNGVPLIGMEYTAGAIYVVRNPLDVTISAAHHYGKSLDEAIVYMGNDDAHAGGGNHVLQVLTSWSNHVRSWTQDPNSGLHVVRYEDLLKKPRKAFGGVAVFLGLKPPKDRLDRAIRFSSFKEMRLQEERKGFRERSDLSDKGFFRKGTAGQWHEVLSPEQVARLVEDHREQMQRFGYVPKGC